MDMEDFNRAKEIREKIRNMKILQINLRKDSVFQFGTSSENAFCRKITKETKKKLFEMYARQIEALEKEFEEL